MKDFALRLALSGALLAAVSACGSGAGTGATPAPDLVTKPVIGSLDADSNGWAGLAIVDVKRFPWDASASSALKQRRYGNPSKTIFKGPKVGALIFSEFAPSWTTKMHAGGSPHYHLWYEWGYSIRGDLTLTDPVSPEQRNGAYYRKREGGWLTRPPFSLHGGGWQTGGMRPQLPYDLLIFEEGDGSVVTLGPSMFGPKADHYNPDFGTKPDPYLPDWKSVKEFSRPWYLDSVRDLEWEDDPNVPGRFVKWLDDDMAGGFRSQLVKIPPGWTAPAGHKEYFEHANRLRYVIWGDMKVWSFNGPADKGKAVRADADTFIYQPPRSIWGYGPGSVSDKGAIWLEVTYAKGLTHGGGPIEAPKTVE